MKKIWTSSNIMLLLRPSPHQNVQQTMLTHWSQGHLNKISDEVIFNPILMIEGWGISSEIALRWLSLDPADGKSTLVQVMAWCHQASSHYLSQCWPRFLLPYHTTRQQWVKPCNIVCSAVYHPGASGVAGKAGTASSHNGLHKICLNIANHFQSYY